MDVMTKNIRQVPVVGITGIIGSGKTALAKLFAGCGAFIIDADEIGREVLENDKNVFTKVVEHFGGNILENDTTVNRKKVAEIVFSSGEHLRKLNDIIHPPMIKLIKEKVKSALIQNKYPMIAVDAALIFEAGVEKRFDYIVTVSASIENIIKRLSEQKGMPEKDIRQRMKSQISQKEKINKAHYIIENNGTFEEFTERGKNLFREICDSFSKSHAL